MASQTMLQLLLLLAHLMVRSSTLYALQPGIAKSIEFEQHTDYRARI